MENQTLVPIEIIKPNPYQPRGTEDPEAVAEIAESIRRNGLMQMPVARRVNGCYELAFGHTRLAAFKLNGEAMMPLIERELTDLQMFELGVSENIKRRDLNPIEQAESMRRYMTEFKKNSVETGEFFNVSEEQVRGTVRLLNLAPEAQTALAGGKINITAAREILSMQKIAPRDVIAKTVKLIEQGRNEHGYQSTPDEVIEQSIRQLPETLHMWNDSRDGKPRSTDRYDAPSWLLSMKNFPNKLLPELTPVDMAIALGIQDDQDMMDRANLYLMSKLDTLDLEDLQLLDVQVSDLKLPAELISKIEHLLNPPACTACPFYIRMDGSHYCGMKTCHTRKMVAWHEQILQSAIKNLGIPLYEKKDGKYQVMTYEHEKLFKARNKDLRLIPRQEVRGTYIYQHFDGVEDDAFLVVMTGKTLQDKTAAVKEARVVIQQTQSAAERHNEMVDQHNRLLRWECTLPIKALFDGFNLAALEVMQEAGFHWSADEDDAPEGTKPAEDAPQEIKTDFMRRVFALAMLEEADDRTTRGNNCESHALWLCDTLVSWGLKPPKGFVKAAQRMDEEIKEAVTAETGQKNGKKVKAQVAA